MFWIIIAGQKHKRNINDKPTISINIFKKRLQV